MSGCPLGNHIPDFIQAVKENNFEKAYEILSETTVLESICGRICPHEKQCQGKCVRGIKGEPVSIGELEAQVGDYASEHNLTIPKEAKKEGSVAIVGTGPAGLTCGAFLAKKGYMVTIFEKYTKLGGILNHGIPEFRLSEAVKEQTIQKILDLGITVKMGQELGQDFTLAELENEYDAIFLGKLFEPNGNRGRGFTRSSRWKRTLRKRRISRLYGKKSCSDWWRKCSHGHSKNHPKKRSKRGNGYLS